MWNFKLSRTIQKYVLGISYSMKIRTVDPSNIYVTVLFRDKYNVFINWNITLHSNDSVSELEGDKTNIKFDKQTSKE